jgi:hypothetical protein
MFIANTGGGITHRRPLLLRKTGNDGYNMGWSSVVGGQVSVFSYRLSVIGYELLEWLFMRHLITEY